MKYVKAFLGMVGFYLAVSYITLNQYWIVGDDLFVLISGIVGMLVAGTSVLICVNNAS